MKIRPVTTVNWQAWRRDTVTNCARQDSAVMKDEMSATCSIPTDRSRGSSVGTATGYGLDDGGVFF
jgi:hypothetical protein